MKILIILLSFVAFSLALRSEQVLKTINGASLEGVVVEETDSTFTLSTKDGIFKLNKSEISERIDLYVEIILQNKEEYIGIVQDENDTSLKLKEDGEEPITIKKSEIVSREILPDFLCPIITLPSKNFTRRRGSIFSPFYFFGKPAFLNNKNVFAGASIGWPCVMNLFLGADFYNFQLRGSFGLLSAQLHLNYYLIYKDNFKWALGPGIGTIMISPVGNAYYILSTNIRWYHLFFEVGAFKFDHTREIYPFPYFQIGYIL